MCQTTNISVVTDKHTIYALKVDKQGQPYMYTENDFERDTVRREYSRKV